LKPLFPYRERRFSVEQVRSTNKKFFGAAVFQKCWQGVGEQPIFAKQIKLHNERKQKSKRESQRIAASQVRAKCYNSKLYMRAETTARQGTFRQMDSSSENCSCDFMQK
jgi:hypothetical protein